MRFERYDRIVDHYAANWPHLVPGYAPILNAMLEVTRQRPIRPIMVLDVGCGPASATGAVASACDPQGRVTLVDGSRLMLSAAERLVGPHLHRSVHGDFTTPAIVEDVFRADCYDLIICSFALHHLEHSQQRETLEHLGASLCKGGMLLCADEVATDRPAGWEVVEKVRAHFIDTNLKAGKLTRDFLALEASLPREQHLPFQPARIDDLASWTARAGLAVSTPLHIFGSALLVALKPD